MSELAWVGALVVVLFGLVWFVARQSESKGRSEAKHDRAVKHIENAEKAQAARDSVNRDPAERKRVRDKYHRH